MVASLLTWWAQAGAHGLAAHRPRFQTAPAQGRPARPGQRPAPTPAVGSQPGDTGRYRPSRRPRVRAQDRPGSPFGPQRRRSPLVLPLPANVKLQVTPDDSLKTFDVREKVGADIDYRDPSQLTFEEYARFQQRQAISDYFREKAKGGVVGAPAAPGSPQAQRLIPKIYLGPIANRIFGGSFVDIRPAGSLTVRAGARFNRNANPALTLRQQSVGDFIFEQNMNVNLTGQIGTRLKLVFNYDTKASFDFDNQMKFDFAGEETDIVRKVDLGNVSLPLNNSLVQGGQNLFGAKVALQFGRLGVTAVGATVRGTADEVRIQNGSQSRQYELKASQYERDRHFFLTQFFRDRYDQALRNLPTVQSGVEIRNLEVYVTNDNRTTENLRNVVALQDLAEPVRLYRDDFRQGTPTARTPAANSANSLLSSILAVPNSRDNLAVEQVLGSLGGGLAKNIDYERVRARKLDPREYTFNAQLGYLSLNTSLLPDQVLGVSFQYLYNGQTYAVGEIQTDYAQVRQDQVIFLKMLKATNPGVGLADPAQNPLNENLRLTRNLPTWDLMMKNIYPLNASQLSRDNFQLQLIYKDDVTGVDLISLKEGARTQNVPLIQVLGLDRVNPNNDRNADGNFDFFPGITIDPELGKIIFPNVQPFGSYLRAQFDPTETALIDKYVYQELYDQTQSDAQQVQVKDKFFLRGRYQGGAGTDEINLPGIGIAQGSVRVRSGSTLLTEGVDYQVFYDQAKVKILNPSYLNSANELRVEFEKNALVQVQPRRLLGARFDYRVSEDASLGGTVLSLLENQAPGINRVNVGDEPGNNTIIGLDGSFRKESRVITKYLDKLPFLSTKEPSSIAFTGEFAKLLAGRSQLGRGENGVSYIDDFENARTPYTLGGLAAIPAWRLAATPAAISTAAGLANSNLRARLAWYTVDQSYYNNGSDAPDNIRSDLNNHYVRGIQRDEIFPNRDLGSQGNGYEYSFDLAYFPSERGTYNYSPGVSGDGKFLTGLPEQNYGGISRGITFDTDFDNANIEYLEFWLMDPFLGGERGQVNDSENPPTNNTTGGELHLNLGNVSEDVLKDGNQHEFENGLPTTDDEQDVRETPYGRVTTQQFLTDAFSAAPGARARQDIGLDGVDDAGEQAQAGRADSYPAIYGSVPDPSNDNFRHHLDPAYNDSDTKILGRYKRYNGYQGNSEEDAQRSSTPYPDKEDLNRDNVVQDVERYYDYRLNLRPGQLEVGRNYIIDKVTNSIGKGSTKDEVTWYQFRIPVREYSAVVGNDNREFGFKSIRFMRMYMTGWREPVVLRLVQPQFVANQWRRFLSRISEGNLTSEVTDADAFSISTVSVEENGLARTDPNQRPVIPYLAPPGIQRDREYGSSSTSRLQNEQSLRLSVTNLRNGYAKAAYKNITINLLRYKRLKLFLHGESDDPTTKDDDIRAFIRIGTDYTQNYYQYSLPLKLTLANETAPDRVWRSDNEIDLAFQDFIDLKAARNRVPNPNFIQPYSRTLDNGATITVVGNPDFSAVQGCMIGMLNPATTDGRRNDKSATLWADEFRVFDFERQDGYAATASFNAKLADVANIIATGSFTSVGFGGLQDKAQQRSLDDILRGDVNVTVAAEKFLPPQFNLKVPVLLQVGHESRTPQYDPLDPDTKLSQSLQKFRNADDEVDNAARAAYRNEVIDQTTSKSISLLNVRKERNPESKTLPKPWDVENLALSYSLTERLHTDIRTDRDFTRAYTGALAYVYQTTPKNYTPLAGIKALDNPYLKIFQQVNFTPLPSRFSFRADIDRRYNERLLQRVLEPGQVPSTQGFDYLVQKVFFFNRIYDLKWDLTKALILDYTATNRGVVDEGPGRTIGDEDIAVRNRDQLMTNLRRGGRTTNFNQTIAATYRLPLDKFPLTDWLSADARYAATYSWQAASTALIDPSDSTALALGNTIQNNAELSANGRIDLVKLYNKVRFLNIINNAPPPPPRPRPAPRNADGTRPTPPPAANVPTDTTSAGLRVVKAVLRSLMTARSLNFTYTRSNGTLLPGYLPKTRFFGFNDGFTAPGLGFILGEQQRLDSAFLRSVYNRNWYTERSDLLNTPFSTLYTDNLTLRTTLEPIRDFNIQLDARKQQVRNREVFYRRRFNEQTGEIYKMGPDSLVLPQASNALGSGSFSISTITIRTLFGDLGANGERSKAFNRFVTNRQAVRDQLQRANPTKQDANGRDIFYSYNSSEVLIQSFRDAYSGKTSDGYKAERKANPFVNIPLPNWNVQYNGLSQVPLFQNVFSSFTLNHAYTSLYNVGAYSTSTTYNDEPEFPNQANQSGQYIPYYIVGQVSIIEGLTPLIGINFQTLNKITGRAEYRTSRGLLLNTTNAQVTEQHTTELIIGAGYATNRLKLPFRVGGEQRVLTNTLTARLDLSLRDNTTVQRVIEGVVDPGSTGPDPVSIGRGRSTITNGALQVQLRPTVDYLLNTRLNLQFYFSQNITRPNVENAFRNATTEGGIQLRYSLQ
ncbi:cell surface protein SprA [uncultured Hymenobacter sp.]|uniref:T9SS outer membrane translocon Sov/SprA n=1 Tax=uncultured Hymenobacter sp. TaxID=170016 RepID=UPI0035CA88AE